MTIADRAPLIGREHHLAQLRSVIDEDDGGLAIVTGEPGIGKTRLIQEALALTSQPFVLGTSSPASVSRPFDLLLSAVEPAVRSWLDVPPELAGVDRTVRSLLGSVAPAMTSEAGMAPASDLIGAGIALLRHLDPRVVVLEDVHWADIESLQVIERVMVSPDRPVFVLTYRPHEVSRRPVVSDLLRAIDAKPAAARIHLLPFDADEVSSYLAATADIVDQRVVDQLMARTGGLPFFLEELINAGALTPEPGTNEPLPWNVAEVVRRQLDQLDHDERELLAMGATLGSTFDFDLLMEALQIGETELIRLLRSVVGHRVVVEDDLDVFRFRHELVRDAILDSLLGRERRRLHDRAFVATATLRPDSYSDLATHARGAGRVHDLLDLAPRGVEHYLAAGATHQALGLAESTLAEVPDHAELLELATRAAWMLGALHRARGHAERWQAVASRQHADRESEALAMVGRIAYEQGDVEAENAVVDELECRAEVGGRTEEQARLLAWLAQHHMLHGNEGRAIELADQAIELAIDLGLDDVRRSASVERGSALSCLDDRLEEGQAVLRAAAEASEAAGDFVVASRAWHNLLIGQSPEQADRTLEAMRQAAVRGGFESMAVYYFAANKVDLAISEGDIGEAMAWASRSRLVGRNTRTWVDLALIEAILLLETGADQSALELLAEVRSGARRFDDPGWIPIARGIALAKNGDLEAARGSLAAVGDSPRLEGILAWALRHLLDAGIGLDEIKDIAARSHSVDASLVPGSPSRGVLRALLAVESGDGDASELVAAALVAVEQRPSTRAKTGAAFDVVIRSELLLAAAEVDGRAGRTAVSREHAAEAAKLLERWPGARRDRALAMLSSGDRGVELTGRELDVARLVGRGMTNGEIAAQLYISRKTVSSHVSHILAKLDMRSRTEVAVWAADRGLLDPVGARA